MLPQLGHGGGTPMPRNESDASSSSTLPTPSAAETMIGAAAFGRTWRKITRPSPAPSARAATTKSRPRSASTSARTSRLVQPRCETDQQDEHREGQAIPQRDRHQENEDARQREADIHTPHQHPVYPAAIVSGGGADQRAEGDGHQGAERGDAQRHPRTPHDPAPDVSTQHVGPEDERPGGRQILQADDVELRVRVERRNERRGDGDDGEKRQDAEAPRRGAVAEEAAPPFAALRALVHRPHRFRGQEQRDEQREPGPERHVATVSRSDGRTRRRGSAMPSRTSATRLPSTTTTLAMSAVAVTTG